MRAIKSLMVSATNVLLLAGIALPLAAQDPTVKVEVEHQVWYLQPVWIGIGAVLLLLVIALAIAAGRGGRDTGTTTTVVR